MSSPLRRGPPTSSSGPVLCAPAGAAPGTEPAGSPRLLPLYLYFTYFLFFLFPQFVSFLSPPPRRRPGPRFPANSLGALGGRQPLLAGPLGTPKPGSTEGTPRGQPRGFSPGPARLGPAPGARAVRCQSRRSHPRLPHYGGKQLREGAGDAEGDSRASEEGKRAPAPKLRGKTGGKKKGTRTSRLLPQLRGPQPRSAAPGVPAAPPGLASTTEK